MKAPLKKLSWLLSPRNCGGEQLELLMATSLEKLKGLDETALES